MSSDNRVEDFDAMRLDDRSWLSTLVNRRHAEIKNSEKKIQDTKMSTDNRVEDFQSIVDRLHTEIKDNGGPVQYTITVKKVERVVTEKQGDWYRHTNESPECKGKDCYAYAPSVPVIAKKEAMVFEQTVTELDIKELVKAVNGLR